jgi:hypothetical protein
MLDAGAGSWRSAASCVCGVGRPAHNEGKVRISLRKSEGEASAQRNSSRIIAGIVGKSWHLSDLRSKMCAAKNLLGFGHNLC